VAMKVCYPKVLKVKPPRETRSLTEAFYFSRPIPWTHRILNVG
jgi:hypothetical protein